MDLKTATIMTSRYTSKKTKNNWALENILIRCIDANGQFHVVSSDGHRLCICKVENTPSIGFSPGDEYILPTTKNGYVRVVKDESGVYGEDSKGNKHYSPVGTLPYPNYRALIPNYARVSKFLPSGMSINPRYVSDVWDDLDVLYKKKRDETIVHPVFYAEKAAVWTSNTGDYFHMVALINVEGSFPKVSFNWAKD